MKRRSNNPLLGFIVIFSLMLLVFSCSQNGSFIEPATDLVLNFINLPQAWTVSQGENVNIGVVYKPADDSADWIKKVGRVAPRATVTGMELNDLFAAYGDGSLFYDVILLLDPSVAMNSEKMIEMIGGLTGLNKLVVIPAYIGPMNPDHDYSGWRGFIRQASEKGAVIAGSHGLNFELGDLSYWRDFPVDVFALNGNVFSWRYFNISEPIEQNLEEPASLVAGIAALIKSREQDITPEEMKRRFQEKGQIIEWVVPEGLEEAYPTWNGRIMEEIERDIKSLGVQEKIKKTCLDAGTALGLEPLVRGQWCFDVLRIDQAHKKATGKGITVAILDWLFNKEDPAFKDRLVTPGSVVDDPVFTPAGTSGHGTWMAIDVVKVAPEAKLMPVRFIPSKRGGDYRKKQYPENLAKAIDYAVRNGADIISISHQPVSQDSYVVLDDAVQQATEAGVSVVYIHYNGKREDVIVPKPIEFAEEDKDYVYVIGTGHIEEQTFPNTWGLSQTAPIVSGVIALMKEVNPHLKPLEIKAVLLKSGRPIEAGFKVLDACKTVKNAK